MHTTGVTSRRSSARDRICIPTEDRGNEGNCCAGFQPESDGESAVVGNTELVEMGLSNAYLLHYLHWCSSDLACEPEQ